MVGNIKNSRTAEKGAKRPNAARWTLPLLTIGFSLLAVLAYSTMLHRFTPTTQAALVSQTALTPGYLARAADTAPFLDLVPSEDGTEVLIGAGGVDGSIGVLYANIGSGPAHFKGSYTMTYSPTIQSYAVSVPGFTPGVDTAAPLQITSTLGLDTGVVEFVRAYVPPSASQSIASMDGRLQLTLVHTDTFIGETYIAIVPSYAPPGPPPHGYRIIGSSYSVRASGATLTSERPMLLRLAYDDSSLAGADLHTLAIFAWDASLRQWERLSGNVFPAQRYISVATSRFTSYALMETNTWYDNFSEFSGLDFSQLDNIDVGGTPAKRTLVLATTPGSGVVVSHPITPTVGFDLWGKLTFVSIANPPTTTLRVDVLAVDGALLLSDVANGMDLSGQIDPDQHPILRLRATFSSTVEGMTPVLEEWQLSWRTAQEQVYLPLVQHRQ